MAGQTTNYLFDYPTSTDYVKDGATAIETLADDVDATLYTALGGAYPGLRLVKKQTIGAGVSSVVVSSAFSSVYENYKIIVSGGVGSASGDLTLVMGATATGYYVSGYFVSVYGAGGALNVVTIANAVSISVGTTSTNGTAAEIEIQSPNAAKRTMFSMRGAQAATNGITFNTNAFLNNDTQYTGFTLTPTSGTLTGGTIYVYGYGAS
jgi:hypothetical protein